MVFTDADCVPSPTWLRELTGPFRNGGAVGVKGAYLTHQVGLVPRFIQQEYAYKYTRMKKLVAIDFIDTFSAAYQKDVFLQNGGFDETFREPSAEDAEFSFRLARKGYRMVFEPKATVYHYHDQTISEYLHRKFGIGYWKAYMLKWIPEKIFNDSHAAPSQRIEILLLAMLLATLPCLAIWPLYAGLGFLAILALFLIVTIPFQLFIGKRDPKVLWIAVGMLMARAGALGLGLLKGLISPPETGPKGYRIQSMGVRIGKRLIDLAGGGIGLLVSAPLMAFTGLAIALESGRPIITKQVKAGESGKPFNLLKLRTRTNRSLPNNEPSFRDTDSNRTSISENQNYNAYIGRALERFRLDHIPQFWNVLKGEMSLVGPQAQELEITNTYDDDQRLLLTVKPGMTGPLQVNHQKGLDLKQRIQLEADYLKNYSLLQDIKLIAKSLTNVIAGDRGD